MLVRLVDDLDERRDLEHDGGEVERLERERRRRRGVRQVR